MATTEPQTWPCRKGQHQSCVATPTDGICACECHPNWRARAEAAERREDVADARNKRLLTWTGRLREAARVWRGERNGAVAILATAYEATDMQRQRAERAEGREARLREALVHRCAVDRVDERCADCQEIIAALAGTPEGEQARAALAGESAPACTEDHHIVLPSGEACVCGENRSELLL